MRIPLRLLSEDEVRVYERGFGRRYRLRNNHQLPEVGLSLTLWSGMFEDLEDTWLRWCDLEGHSIPTGEETSAVAEERAATAEERAEREATARQEAEARAARLALRPGHD